MYFILILFIGLSLWSVLYLIWNLKPLMKDTPPNIINFWVDNSYRWYYKNPWHMIINKKTENKDYKITV